jgi:hypothetical protein
MIDADEMVFIDAEIDRLREERHFRETAAEDFTTVGQIREARALAEAEGDLTRYSVLSNEIFKRTQPERYRAM